MNIQDCFRIDRFDLLKVQGTLKNLLQHHSSKASVLQCSAFFVVQLSHPYVTTGKTITLEAVNSTWLSSCQRHVRPIFEMKWRPRAFSKVSTGDSEILSSCDMNDEHA